jgi:hypothetical protein
MYNRGVQTKRILLCLSLAAAMALAGCSKNINNEEAVRQGVINYLAKQSSLDLNGMDISVSTVTFKANEADAVIAFRPKGAADPSNAMQMRYTLERKGGEWVVKSKAGMSGDPHTGAMQGGDTTGGQAMPPGHPSADGTKGGMPPALPPGHPSMGAAPSGEMQLPPGHPQIGAGSKAGDKAGTGK